MPTNSGKSIVRVVVGPGVSASFQAICKKRGMTQISLVCRLIRWCAKQEETIQAEILNSDPTANSDESSRRLLRYLANSPRRSDRKL
jgi:hypothetical protein